jgi:hypothetical protein
MVNVRHDGDVVTTEVDVTPQVVTGGVRDLFRVTIPAMSRMFKGGVGAEVVDVKVVFRVKRGRRPTQDEVAQWALEYATDFADVE